MAPRKRKERPQGNEAIADMNDKVITLALSFYLSGIDHTRMLAAKYAYRVSLKNRRLLQTLIKQNDEKFKEILDNALATTSAILHPESNT